MPKVIMTDTKGLHQVTGTGINFENSANVTKLDLGAQVSLDPQSDGSIFSGAAGEINQWGFRCGNTLAVHALGTQTLLAPALATTGLNIAGDQSNDDGWEIRGRSSAALGRLNKDYFTVGTSPAFYVKCKFSVANVSGSDDLSLGFATVEAHKTSTVASTHRAAICYTTVDGADVDIRIKTDDATTATDTDITVTNLADGVTTTWEILVDGGGNVTYKVDGVAPSDAVAFSFPAGINLTPRWQHIQHNGAGQTGAVIWQEFEFGLQAHRTA